MLLSSRLQLLMRRQLADEATVVLIRRTRSVAELPRFGRLRNIHLWDLRNNGRWYYRSKRLRRNDGGMTLTGSTFGRLVAIFRGGCSASGVFRSGTWSMRIAS